MSAIAEEEASDGGQKEVNVVNVEPSLAQRSHSCNSSQLIHHCIRLEMIAQL